MKFEKVSIKQIPDEYATMTGLHKYGRSKMPKTFEFLQAGMGLDERFITGLDEDAISISRISDPLLRAERQAEVKELRLYLEDKLKKDLSPTSKYWETFGIHISADSDLILNKSNALHQVMYAVLVANHYAAPDKDSASNPEYINAKYYCHVAERADDEAATDKISKDRVKAKLVELYDNHDLMVLVGQFLEGDKYKPGMSDKTLYNMLSSYIDDSREPENPKRFMKAVNADASDLQFKITVDRAIKKKIIRFKEGYYQRGQVTLGKTPTDVIANLRKPEFATEFLSIQEEID